MKHPLPVPSSCPHCHGNVEFVSHTKIYARAYGPWPWALLCLGCGAYVGLHPYTAIPLGTLATAPMREARKRAKSAFNPLWEGEGAPMNRNGAYAWLANALQIDAEACHIGWLDVAGCERVVKAVADWP